MANGKKTYTIEINGVRQAIDQVDALMKRIDDLDQRLQRLQTVKVDVTASASTSSNSQAKSDTSRYDAAKSEAAAQKEITDQLALQNEENLKALQALVKKKEQTKEIVKTQQQIAQGIRDESGEYANTLAGRRAMLSDLKKQLAGTAMGTDQWDELRDKVKAVNDEVLNMEKSFGVFGRNVGNYESAFDGLRKFTVTIGDADREFSSLREASRALRMEMQGVDTTTEEGRRLFEDYQNAIHQVSVATDQMADSADRAASSNKGLHDTLELMEGAVGVAQVGQGFASVLGIDDSSLAQQMTKLQGLMSALQGIKTLQDQMERGVGGGGWLAKLWKGLDAPIKSLKTLNAQLKTSAKGVAGMGTAGAVGAAGMTAFSVATNVATAAVRAFGKATVIFALLEAALWIVEKLGDAMGWLSGKIMNFFTGEEDAKDAALRVTDALEAQNKALEANNAYLEHQVELGKMSVAEMQKKQLEQYAISIMNTSDLLKGLIEDTKKMNKVKTTYNTPDFTATFEQIEKNVKAMESWMDESEFDEEVERMARDAFLSLKDMADKSPEEVARFVAALNSSELFNSGFNRWLKELPEETQEAARGVLENFTSMSDGIMALLGRMAQAGRSLSDEIMDLKIAAMPDGIDKTISGITLQYQRDVEAHRKAYEADNKELKKWEEERKKVYEQDVKNARNAAAKQARSQAEANRKRLDGARKTRRELADIERRIENDKIQAMRDGLAKTLAQLDLERRNRLAEAMRLHEDGKMTEAQYREDQLAINQLYDRREFESKKKWQDEWEAYQRESSLRIMDFAHENSRIDVENRTLGFDVDLEKLKNGFETTAMESLLGLPEKVKMEWDIVVAEALSAYERLKEEFEESGETDLGIKQEMEDALKLYEELRDESEKALEEYTRSYKKMGEAMNEVSVLEGKITKMRELMEESAASGQVDDEMVRQFEELNRQYEEQTDLLNEMIAALRTYNDEVMTVSGKREKVIEISADNPEDLFRVWFDYYRNMLAAESSFIDDRKALQDEAAKAELEHQKALLINEREQLLKETEKRYDDEIELGNHSADEIILIEEQRDIQLEDIRRNYEDRIAAIEAKAQKESLQRERDFHDQRTTIQANYFSGVINEITRFSNKMTEVMSEAEAKSTNEWGIIDLGEFQNQLYEAQEGFEHLQMWLDNVRQSLRSAFATGLITADQYNTWSQDIEGLEKTFSDGLANIDKESRNKLGKLIDGLNTYIQQLGNGVQELLSTIWDSQGKQLDAMKDALDKQNDLLDEKLSKQEEITQKHKDAIDSIEEELDSARGDRRQHLIDSLNAQIQAQRASLAQEKKIQAQKEANQRKLDALDKKRKQEQKKQAIVSATISAALATANGLATSPFIPVGVAMGALAASLGAAQVAIIANQKYAKGGLLEGPDHAHGGIKVGNTGIEVEGGEYVTNRRSTMHNLNILEYINGKKRKLTLEDFIDFFNGRSTPSGSAKRKNFLATGGQVPALDDNFDAGRLIKQVRAQEDNRPVVVSVVDVVNGMDRVRRVQALAGLAE